MWRAAMYISFGVFLVLCGVAAEMDDVYVDTKEGPILGKVVEFEDQEITNVSAKINVFKGIPYAEKPLRFTKSVPKANWTTVLNATEYTVSCPQLIQPEFQGAVPYEFSEDCLGLNVFAPNQTERKLPVMVYIHGGGYTTGSSMTPSFSGIPLAAIGHVIVVTINYRVGVLGFLSTGDEASPGNFGLMDQALALKWVRRNIEVFGGNPSMVTIFGESAGSSSVDMHVVSKYSHDLFDQAITESGQAVAFWNMREEYEMKKRETAFQLGSLLNCTVKDSVELVGCLTLVDAMLLEATSIMNQLRMGPTIDGEFIDDYPRAITERGEFKHCPMIIGFNRDEGTVNVLFDLFQYYYDKEPPFVSEDEFNMLVPKSLTTISGFTSDLLEDAVKHEYVDWSRAEQPDYNYLRSIVDVYGDDEFSCPAILTARAHATMTSEPVYLYFFTHVPEQSIFEINGTGPGWLGAGHAEELPFVFGYDYIPEVEAVYGTMSDEEEQFSVKMMKYWTHFAWTGRPSSIMVEGPITDGMNQVIVDTGIGGESTMEMNVTMDTIQESGWLPFTVPELQYKELALSSSIKRGLKADQCAFWDEFKLELQSYLVSMDQTELEWREEFDDWQNDLEDWRTAFSEYSQKPYCEV